MIRFLCTCENVSPGDYTNQEVLTVPWPDGKKRKAGVDRCILSLIMALWSMGIKTKESCCGHGKRDGFVSVDYDSIASMKKLGFQLDPRFPDIFILPMTRCESAP
jgi:hypothetical protein